jgi:hypothetical protein
MLLLDRVHDVVGAFTPIAEPTRDEPETLQHHPRARAEAPRAKGPRGGGSAEHALAHALSRSAARRDLVATEDDVVPGHLDRVITLEQDRELTLRFDLSREHALCAHLTARTSEASVFTRDDPMGEDARASALRAPRRTRGRRVSLRTHGQR